jgi:hypothetical protein
MPLDPHALYIELGRLVQTMPAFQIPLKPDDYHWCGRASAVIATTGDVMDIAQFDTAVQMLTTSHGNTAHDIRAVLYRALAKAELAAPVAARGAFIPVGEHLDAFAALHKVLSTAKSDVLIVDPYLDARALLDFAPSAPDRVALRLVADEKKHAPTLLPAAQRWIARYGVIRPLQARLAATRVLHDRLIIVDGRDVWDVSQSLKDLAARSPASITRADAEGAVMKIDFYEDVWKASTPIA